MKIEFKKNEKALIYYSLVKEKNQAFLSIFSSNILLYSYFHTVTFSFFHLPILSVSLFYSISIFDNKTISNKSMPH